MKINKLTISNFAGIKEEKFNFDGKDAKIYGNNATGKTTTATALQWLLFDKGLDGSTKSFNPVPLNEKNEENYELIPTVFAEFEIDGKITTFKKESHPKYTINQKTNRKEYSRSRTKKQYINDESIKVKDYKARIDELIDEDVFKLITNPQAFNLLDWKKRRSLLFEIAKPINDEDVIKTNDDFKELNNILGDHEIETKKKILTDKIKQINKDIKDIPIRINQTQQNKQDVPEFDNDRHTIIKQEIEQLENERIDIQNGAEEINLRNQLADKQSELKRIEANNSASNENKIHALTNELHVENGTVANLKTRLKQNKQQITHEENRRNQLLENHKGLKSDLEKAKNQKFEYLDDNVCSCCGQQLPAEQVSEVREKALQKFNANKSKELETIQTSINHIISEGKKIKPIIEKLEDDNNNLQIKINEAEERSARIQNKINKLKTTHVDVTQTDEYKAVMLEINEINQKRSNIRKTIQDKVSGIDDKISELTQEKSEIEVSISIEKSNKHLDDVISELRNEEDRLLDEKEKYSHDLYILKEFTTTKVKMLTENINNEFDIAEFKLFNTLVNGELEETCSTTVNGVEYDSGLNNASRINVGLDIINTLSKHFKVTAPIFIDNAESVTELIKTESQQIQLIVNEQDKKLMSCNDTSKANALLDMVTQGLNPAKNQCYFIPYGNKMQLQRSYHGNVMMLKRDAGAQDVVAQVIYKGDTFKQEMGETGRIKAIKHEQDFFNIDKENIIGAYCTIVFNDGRDNYIEVMTIEQIKQAWMQSSMIKDEKALQNSKTHNNFKEEMAKKTVINRAAKRYINTSTDSNLFKYAQESEQRQRKEVLDAEVEENANQEQLDFEQPVLEEAQYTELENDKPIDVSDFEEIKEPATEKESEEEPF